MSLWTRVKSAFTAARQDAELDDELAFHIAERTDELIVQGMDEYQARREAMRRFGNFTTQRENTRDMDIALGLETLLKNLRYGARQLRLAPGFTAVAVLSLALGIGANSAIFQLIDMIRLRSLPVSHPEELVAVDNAPEFYRSGWYQSRNTAYTYAQYEQIRDRQQAFTGVMAFGDSRFNLSRGGESRYAEGLYVSANYFDVLGVAPMLGRTFTAEEGRTQCAAASAVLSYDFWQREFGGDVGALGRPVYLDGVTFPVAGVMPRGFTGVEPARRFDVLLPLCADGLIEKVRKARTAMRHAWWLTIIGRMKPGWTVERTSAHMRDLSPGVFRESVPEVYRAEAAKKYMENKLEAVSASGGVTGLRQRYGNPLWILLATAGLVLLIACANLANLLLARASAREREIAVRQAMGASRWRLIGQLLSESFLLAALGGLLGAVLARGLSQAMVAFIDSGSNTLFITEGMDWRVFGFTALLAMVTCLLFGLAPAIRATASVPAQAMRGGRGAIGTAERNGLRRVLVVSQIALSLVLLVGALLFGRSLRNLVTTETGIQPEGVLVAGIDTKLQVPMDRRRFMYEEMEDRLKSVPGVMSVATAWLRPFGGSGWNEEAVADGKDAERGKKLVWMNRVGPNYFRTMGTPMLAGRDFTRRDDMSAPQVAIVTEEFARQLMGGANPVGRTFRVDADAGEPDRVYSIVGLVKNTKYNGLREEFRAIAFFPMNQDPKPPAALSFMVRVRGSLDGVMTSVRRRMVEVNPQFLVDFDVLEVNAMNSVLRERLMASLSGGFGLLAGLLSMLGLYGVMSYMVARRQSEIGVRMALGAGWREILSLVAREAGVLVAVGIAIGLAGSFAVSRYAESLLYGLQPNDALTLVLACAGLAVTALLATMIPARRALKLDPVTALRQE